MYIRWFFKDETAKKWVPFNGYDSIRIETKFREHRFSFDGSNEDIDTSASLDSLSEMVLVRGGLFEVSLRFKKCIPIYWDDHFEPDNSSEVTEQSAKEEAKKKRKSPTAVQRMIDYQRRSKIKLTASDQSADILRGSWFKEISKGVLEPLEDEYMAEKIENSHVAYFTDVADLTNEPVPDQDIASSISSEQLNISNKKAPIHVLQFPEYEIEWFSQDEIYLYSNSATSNFRKRLGISKSGYRLVRGYNQFARIDDKPPDITHLCFVIHGIGQKLATGAIVKACSDLRGICNRVRLRYFPDLEAQNKRVEFLPVEWRSSLQLDNGLVETITPVNLGSLRNILNSSALDILYYSSPLYRPEITQGMNNEMKRLYSMFCTRNPYFEPNGGQVSVVAHSLGCVIAYDILSGCWDSENHVSIAPSLTKSLPDDCIPSEAQLLKAKIGSARNLVSCLENQLKMLESSQEQEPVLCHLNSNTLSSIDLSSEQGDTPRFARKLSNFFALGSPLSVFLALRGLGPTSSGTMDHLFSKSVCERFFNIYHPADPVAYRIEPLVLQHYCQIQPLRVHPVDAQSKPNYDAMTKILLKDKQTIKKFRIPEYEQPGATSEAPKETIPNGPRPSLSDRMFSLFSKSSQNQMSDLLDPNNNSGDQTSGGSNSGLISMFRSRQPSIIPATDENEEPENLIADQTSENTAELAIAMNNYLNSESNRGQETEAQFYSTHSSEVHLEHRLDYQLHESRYESAYISFFTSHNSYWTNPDIALFIMTQLFSECGPIGKPANSKL
ncbi:Phospholipase ddhd1 [Cichlidogyrus casuarinus]|uniref:Phospholipase ddhd1 n=1 Tax=Cichlidogyrus casuarinus TaxID=1844966 RepID=A0ABD2Q7R7_9PLAT